MSDRQLMAAGTDEVSPAALGAVVDALRRKPPRVHALVAPVAQPLVANIAAALAIDVSMTIDPVDVSAMAAASDSVLVNLGMMDDHRRDGALRAASAGTPFVLDPVKVDRAPDRLVLARALVDVGPTVVKGNAAEMAALTEQPEKCVRVVTGPQDRLTAGSRTAVIHNGSPMLSRVIATGCATGLLAAAMIAVERDAFIASSASVAMMSVAGELAAETAKGPGSFAVHLIDALAALDGAALAARVRVHA
ncbi:MAG: hydroxyethylthiazole kinase [Pseudomonadota bacterium]